MLGIPIKRASTPSGMDMVLWNHDSDDGYSIMTYPVAVNYGKYFVNRGDIFCCPLTRIPKGKELEIWDALVNGNITLHDCVEYFHEPEKHAYYLGWR